MEFRDHVLGRCACAAAPGPFTLAGTERKYERSRPFLVRHLKLELSIELEDKSVRGIATLEVERTAPDESRIRLDALGFQLEKVELLTRKKARPARYEYDGEVLSVDGLGARETIRIRYRATPQRGLYFLEPDRAVRDRPVQVWSQCQDEDARYWFPCHDKPHVKMTTELAVDVPRGFVALSNGTLVTQKTEPRARRWHYHYRLEKPHPSYLVTLVVGHFAIEKGRDARLAGGRKVPIRYYVPPAQRGDAKRSFGETPRMVELFSRLTGVDFPWERYSQVVVSDFIFGGMENTTATTLHEYALLDRRAGLDVDANYLLAHELAHQWFGDFVTCRDWSHAWLNEGFATFFEHLEREDRLGRDEYDHGIKADLETYLGEARSEYRRAIVSRDYDQPIDLFDRHLYEKGALVLHTLRRELGDQSFFSAVRAYLGAHAHGIVETNDLQRALEQASGRSLERFFDQWVYRPGHPELKVSIGYEQGLVSVTLKQTQKPGETATFAFDFEIEVCASDGKITRHQKRVTEAHDALIVPMAERPRYVAFDPEMRVMAELNLEAPADLLQRQLSSGSSAQVRWSAARALAKRSDPTTLAALGDALSNEDEPWMVRAEAARALGRSRAPAALGPLEKNLKAQSPKLRRAVIAALGELRSQGAYQALRGPARRDPSYLVEAEAARSLGQTRQPGAREVLVKMLDRPSWADVVRRGALDGLAALRDPNAVPEVQARTRYGISTPGRRSALGALAALGEGKRVREHLEGLLDDRDPHLRQEVVRALVTLGDPRCRAALHRAAATELDGRVSRQIRQALRDLGSRGQNQKRLTDDLESLRSELGELKARLSKLEAHDKAPTKPARPTKKRTKKRARRQ